MAVGHLITGYMALEGNCGGCFLSLLIRVHRRMRVTSKGSHPQTTPQGTPCSKSESSQQVRAALCASSASHGVLPQTQRMSQCGAPCSETSASAKCRPCATFTRDAGRVQSWYLQTPLCRKMAGHCIQPRVHAGERQKFRLLSLLWWSCLNQVFLGP